MTIIAEIGQSHLGSVERAYWLIEAARQNGADLVKSQLFNAQSLYGKQVEGELTFDQAKKMFDFGEENGIEVFFSVFDVERVRWCEEIGVSRYKVACSQNQNFELRDAIRETGKECLVSYESTYELERTNTGLICVPRYPAWASDVEWVNIEWGLDYDGYSDHTIGIDAAMMAVARGCELVEKHFALSHSKETDGPDAEWSATPEEMRELVRFAKVVEEVL